MDEAVRPTAAAPPERSGPPRSVIAAALAIIALVAISVIVAVALPDEPATYPADSPEAAFQAFYGAWETGDTDAAYALLSADVKRTFTADSYRDRDSEQSWQRDEDRRVVLLKSEVTGDRAVLDLRVDTFYDGGFGGSRYSDDRSIRLVRVDGAWHIDQPLLGIEPTGYEY